MKIGFFEVEEWAHEKIKQKFPEALITQDKLLPENAKQYADLEIISTFIYSQVSSSTLVQMPKVRFIATRSTGFDHVDIKYCNTNDIVVSNVPRYGDRTVAEFTFALLLTLTRHMHEAIERTKGGSFDSDGLTGTDLEGKTIGIVGFGQIGREVAKIARGFEMKMLVHNHTVDRSLESQFNCTFVELEFLLRNSDIVTLHLPLTPETKHIINCESLKSFKKGSYLINTSRGNLIETQALLEGLKEDIFAGVGLGVMEEESLFKEEAELISSEFRNKVDLSTLIMDHMLIKHPKVVITPHNAFNSKEAINTILMTSLANIEAFIKGDPQNKV